MSWIRIWSDAVPGVAGITIYDKDNQNFRGRYVVCKSMRLPDGRFRTAQKGYHQKPAAINFAKKWLTQRAKLRELVYNPGVGEKTLAFKPVPGGVK